METQISEEKNSKKFEIDVIEFCLYPECQTPRKEMSMSVLH